MPVLDPQVRECLTILPGPDAETYFLSAPVRWIEAGEDEEMTALSVGSLDGKERKEPVATLHSLAVRVATHSSNFQSQRTQTAVPNSRPTTPHSHAVSSKQAPKASRPVSLDQAAPSSRPASIQPAPAVNLSTISIHERSVPASGSLQHPLANGGPPEKIFMPPPPVQIERTKTEYVTPAEDPAEIKQLA